VERLPLLGLVAVLLIAVTPTPAHAHGDILLVDEVLALAPGASVDFDAELHYHRVVGQVTSTGGPVGVRLIASQTTTEVFALEPGSQQAFNVLVRCCDEAWAPHTLVIDNAGREPVTVKARASLVHDDLAVMVDGAESGTRIAILLLALGWWALVWRETRRRDAEMPLHRPTVGLVSLTFFVLGLGIYATARYGVGGAPSVVAGNADVPVLPRNPIVSRASLLMGLSMIGWAFVGRWWVRARSSTSRIAWLVLGVALGGAAFVVAVSILIAYGGLLVQTAWLVAAAGPILLVLLTSRGGTTGSEALDTVSTRP
jgi:hypothetical protein